MGKDAEDSQLLLCRAARTGTPHYSMAQTTPNGMAGTDRIDVDACLKRI
jgi:hypothetical protein